MINSDSQHTSGKRRNSAAIKPQYVLITDNGEERTSHVTFGSIFKAVYEIEANGYVTLEKCQPVTLVRQAAAFAITYYKDSRISVYFKVRKTVVRMCKSGFNCEDAADIMCDFFQSAELPDMSDWICEEFSPVPQKSESKLTVDGEDFRYFGCVDVVAALENIIEGKSRWLLHEFTGENGGYVNIYRCGDCDKDFKYKVEFVKWTEPTPTGYRGIVSDTALMRQWLWDFASEHKYPEPDSCLESFDVTDYFQRLAFRFLDETDKEDNNER